MTRFLSLSSGSNGNCYYLGNEQVSVLIDVGIGVRTIKKRLAEHDIDIADISFVLVSHDHVDHIKSLGNFSERYRKPVYVSSTLAAALNRHFCTRGHMTGCMRKMEPEVAIQPAQGVEVTSFRVPHDATETVGFHIDFFGEKFTFMTDIGEVTDTAVHYASLADHLIVESNYDIDMLLGGPYTHALKMRIVQGNGHMSNDQTSSLLRRSYHSGLKDICLCHLSENNNTPTLAFDCARRALGEIGVSVGKDVSLTCLPRREASEVIEIR